MPNSSVLFIALFVLLVVCAPLASGQANLMANGGFETGNGFDANAWVEFADGAPGTGSRRLFGVSSGFGQFSQELVAVGSAQLPAVAGIRQVSMPFTATQFPSLQLVFDASFFVVSPGIFGRYEVRIQDAGGNVVAETGVQTFSSTAQTQFRAIVSEILTLPGGGDAAAYTAMVEIAANAPPGSELGLLVDSVQLGLPQEDSDQDSVPDTLDNCRLVDNPGQRDTDLDGFGNFCDPDFNNDGIVNFTDLGTLRGVYFTSDENSDLDGDGSVNPADLGIFKSYFFLAPGPGAASR